MKNFASEKNFIYLIIIGFLSFNNYSQEQKMNVRQDPKFEQVLNEKRKINSSLTVNDSYKIQIYSGSSEIAKKTLTEFRQDYKEIDAIIIFNTPNYKVWVGNFRTRIEAEKIVADINSRYKNILLIKPTK